MGRLSGSMATLGLAGLLVVAGAGYALGSAGNRRITVCVKHHGGALYKARKCARHDHKLRWNAQGPPGPQGSPGPQGRQGDQGTQGTQGPAGLSSEYLKYGTAQSVSSDGTTQPVVTMSVPTGTYEVRLTLEAW